MKVSRGRWLLLAPFIALVFAVVAPRDLRAQSPVVIEDGHVDIGPVLVEGKWRLQLRDDTGDAPVWRELSDVVLHAADAARVSVPAGEQYRFLGVEGTDVWLLPQAQAHGIVWPGWNTQHPSIVGEVQRSVSWQLHSVAGPGDFILFLTGSFGESTVLFSTRDPLPQSIAIELGTHVHGNWAFTAPGVYRLTMSMSGTRASGGLLSDTRELTVTVGDGAPGPSPTTAGSDGAALPTNTPTLGAATSTATPTIGTTPGAGTGTRTLATSTSAPNTSTSTRTPTTRTSTPNTGTGTATPATSTITPRAGSNTAGAGATSPEAGATTGPDVEQERSTSALVVLTVSSAAAVALLMIVSALVWRGRHSRKEPHDVN